jgi:hypothetical protein
MFENLKSTSVLNDNAFDIICMQDVLHTVNLAVTIFECNDGLFIPMTADNV